jgi:thymidylate synthase
VILTTLEEEICPLNHFSLLIFGRSQTRANSMTMFVDGETFDDLLRNSIELVLAHGQLTKPSKGPASELIGLSMRLRNPRARFSRTETRATLFSALGETLWYLSGTNEFDLIEYYIPSYRLHCDTPADVKESEAAYGPRIINQLEFIRNQIKKTDTRKAVLSIYRMEDHSNLYDVPCTCTLQFFPRAGVLHAIGQMRSNDLYMGMAHDIFAFTFLQELLARSSGLEIGAYYHQVGSLHLYERDRDKALRYLSAGVADTIPMPRMPVGDPEPGLQWLLSSERAIREIEPLPDVTGIDPYWRDLAGILKLKALSAGGTIEEMFAVKAAMSSDPFQTFITDEIAKHEAKTSGSASQKTS